mmetsp:Transcript_766/g.1624  ORF Transcript_766/g.1624 Transcript_766/m.1624 type:complete len:256 (+) Transcript_766:74-841(+)
MTCRLLLRLGSAPACRVRAVLVLLWACIFVYIEASPDLVEHHVTRLEDDDDFNVQTALDNIRLLAEHVGDMAPAVVKIMKEHESQYVRQRAVEVFEAMATTDAENAGKHVLDLIDALDDENTYVQQRVIEALTLMPEAVAPYSHRMTKVYNSDNKYVRQRLIELYEKWAETAPKLAERHVTDCIIALEDEDRYVIEHALDALRKMPYVAAPYFDYIYALKKHQDGFVRGRARLLIEFLQMFKGPEPKQQSGEGEL